MPNDKPVTTPDSILEIIPPVSTPAIGNFMEIIAQALSSSEEYLSAMGLMRADRPHQRFIYAQETAKFRGRRK